MKKELLNETLAPGITLTSNPFSVDESTKEIGLYIKYVIGAETGITVTVVTQDIAEADWFEIAAESGGAGTNPVLSYEHIFVGSATRVLNVPVKVRGDYRVVVVPNKGAADGTIEISMSEVKD